MLRVTVKNDRLQFGDGLSMTFQRTLPDMPRIGFAVGFTGHGLAFGARVAERAVDHLLMSATLGAVDVERLN